MEELIAVMECIIAHCVSVSPFIIGMLAVFADRIVDKINGGENDE